MKAFITLFLAISQLGFASIPDYSQMGIEIQSILSAKELKECLGDETVRSIEKVASGYLVDTGHSKVLVDVLYLPEGERAGKPFKLRFHEKLSLEGHNV
jgi:hypothetical protein